MSDITHVPNWNDYATNPYAWGVSVIATVFAVGNLALGYILIAYPERLANPSFTYILHAGPHWAWGAAFVASGTLALFGQYTHRMWPARMGHAWSAFLCLWWVISFSVAAWHIPTGGLTGIAAYGIVAATHIVISVVSPHR